MDLAAARAAFSPDTVYLDTATMGLPPARTSEALAVVLDEWRRGVVVARDYDADVAAARSHFARLIGVDPSWVSVGSQVSVFVGLVAASLADNAEVITAVGDFTSVLFPFAAQQHRGVVVKSVALEDIPDAITERTSLVAVSAVQSADGRVADLEAIRCAADRAGSAVLVDTTQAAGWLPIDASRFTYTVCAAYKWLLAPRGTAFMTVVPSAIERLVPHTAGWYAGADIWDSIYGMPLRLAADARRFDVSPAWHAWVGAANSLELISQLDPHASHQYAVTLANRFRQGVGLPQSNSAIVAVDLTCDVAESLRAHRIRASVRAGRLRLSFFVHNDEDDVDLSVSVLTDSVAR